MSIVQLDILALNSFIFFLIAIKVEIVIPKNKMKELEEFLAEQGGKITADLPVQVQDASE